MNTLQEVLAHSKIEGNILFLPQQLERKLYVEINKQTATLGGKWNKKAGGLVFDNLEGENLTTALQELITGEVKDLRKKYQFFETPDHIADIVVEHAELKPYHRVLEPSAGRGALIKAALRAVPKIKQIDAVEIWETNSLILAKTLSDKILNLQTLDFLEAPVWAKYDRIIANPPFSGNQDIDHIRKMYDCLALGGRLVAISSPHWTFAKDKKSEAFRDWLIDVDANVYDIESNSFEQTAIATKLIVIDKNLYETII